VPKTEYIVLVSHFQSSRGFSNQSRLFKTILKLLIGWKSAMVTINTRSIFVHIERETDITNVEGGLHLLQVHW